jgi:RHS repeat-associated protein
MQMPGRNASTGDYRYGFQGQETDNEITGSESHVSYKYRMHDARLGSFLSLDPLAPSYPHNSPYAFSENRVIDMIELEGLEAASIQLDLRIIVPVLENGVGPTLAGSIGVYMDRDLNFQPFWSAGGGPAMGLGVAGGISASFYPMAEDVDAMSGLGLSGGYFQSLALMGPAYAIEVNWAPAPADWGNVGVTGSKPPFYWAGGFGGYASIEWTEFTGDRKNLNETIDWFIYNMKSLVGDGWYGWLGAASEEEFIDNFTKAATDLQQMLLEAPIPNESPFEMSTKGIAAGAAQGSGNVDEEAQKGTQSGDGAAKKKVEEVKGDSQLP